MTIARQLQWLERIATGLLLLAHLLVYAALARLAEFSPTAAEFLRDAVVFAQVGLVAALIIIGPRTGALWMTAPFVGLAGLWLVWFCIHEAAGVIVVRIIAVEALGVATICFAARRHGIVFGRFGNKEPFALRIRYSLRSLMLGIGAFAFFARPLRDFHSAMAAESVSADAVMFATALPGAAATIAALWVVMSEGSMLVRAMLAIMFVVASGGIGLTLCGREADWWTMTLWLGPQAFIVAASLGVFRACGYRLVRRLSATSVPFRSLNFGWKKAEKRRAILVQRFVEQLS